jgi:hypothetical protein
MGAGVVVGGFYRLHLLDRRPCNDEVVHTLPSVVNSRPSNR